MELEEWRVEGFCESAHARPRWLLWHGSTGLHQHVCREDLLLPDDCSSSGGHESPPRLHGGADGRWWPAPSTTSRVPQPAGHGHQASASKQVSTHASFSSMRRRSEGSACAQWRTQKQTGGWAHSKRKLHLLTLLTIYKLITLYSNKYVLKLQDILYKTFILVLNYRNHIVELSIILDY
jgi:hypothetical protein